MTLVSSLAQSYIAVVDHPIAEDNFAGEDRRYSLEFERLEAVCQNTQTLHRDVTPDWDSTAEQATIFLREHSKDLRVAAWLTWALYCTRSWTGLEAGLALLERLLTARWEDLHPRKERTRAAALGWLQLRLEGVFDTTTLTTLEASWLQTFSLQLGQLEALLQPRLHEAAPLLLPLVRRLDEQRRRQVQSITPVESATTAPTPTQVATAQALQGPLESDKEAHRLLRQLQEGARTLSSWWLRQRLGDHRALRLNRALLWSGIDSLPAHDAQGVTGLRGLPADRLRYFQEREAAGDFALLLGELEVSLTRAPFWLDGQRLAWQCLQTLGVEAACLEIEWPLELLLERLPGIEALAFHDGQPFADAQTRLWLSGLTKTKAAQPAAASSEARQDAWDDALAEALVALRASGLKSAVRHLQQGRRSAQGERQRLLWDLASVRLLIQARQFELAHFQLVELDAEHGALLGRWEPRLALEILQARRQCLEALPATADSRTQLQQLRPRLCRLDLEAALD
ncbi:type VI secretion system protein VasJ [Pseudomonas sp. SORGH_AS 211]|uniref:type VI secretion system protein TssA n=1 Tax=Pseudomonas sp. SORGH_AS_0211 TaxID=3041796 RepID=UPI0028647055|nr:type VI secretion system protein TssA [Pseudomonas sp. SORGH_AS_0211]MDR6180556.1 type VI secretion system protein VasJ [Pseudomonas sp. SORGH_AS_0211]